MAPLGIDPDAVVDAGVDADVWAAGGVVWRTGTTGQPEMLLVHRPKYDDWTFAKGKLDPGENSETAAVREVEEETGLRCVLGQELCTTRYLDRKGRVKAVRYWAMTVVGGAFTPNDEVDETCWLDIEAARGRLSYGRDEAVLDSFARFAGVPLSG